jgi:hypothetical protein
MEKQNATHFTQRRTHRRRRDQGRIALLQGVIAALVLGVLVESFVAVEDQVAGPIAELTADAGLGAGR